MPRELREALAAGLDSPPRLIPEEGSPRAPLSMVYPFPWVPDTRTVAAEQLRSSADWPLSGHGSTPSPGQRVSKAPNRF